MDLEFVFGNPKVKKSKSVAKRGKNAKIAKKGGQTVAKKKAKKKVTKKAAKKVAKKVRVLKGTAKSIRPKKGKKSARVAIARLNPLAYAKDAEGKLIGALEYADPTKLERKERALKAAKTREKKLKEELKKLEASTSERESVLAAEKAADEAVVEALRKWQEQGYSVEELPLSSEQKKLAKKISKKTSKKKTTKKKGSKKVARKKAKKKVAKKERVLYKGRMTPKKKKKSVAVKLVRTNPRKRRSVKRRRNPILGEEGMMKAQNQFMRYFGMDMKEAGSLALGGATYGLVNSLLARFASPVHGALVKVPVLGSALPTLLVGAVINYFGERQKMDILKTLGKGLIGSSVVGMGVNAAQMIPGLSPQMAGYEAAPQMGYDAAPQMGYSRSGADFGGVDYTPDMRGVDYTPDMSGVDYTPDMSGDADFGEYEESEADFGGYPEGLG